MAENELPTDDEIDAADTATLRKWCKEYSISEYNTRRNVFTLVLDDEIVSAGDLVALVGQTLSRLQDRFKSAGLEPTTKQEYGRIVVSVWEPDTVIRDRVERAIIKLRENGD